VVKKKEEFAFVLTDYGISLDRMTGVTQRPNGGLPLV
jgi:hypothetical protein